MHLYNTEIIFRQKNKPARSKLTKVMRNAGEKKHAGLHVAAKDDSPLILIRIVATPHQSTIARWYLHAAQVREKSIIECSL